MSKMQRDAIPRGLPLNSG